MKEVGSNQNIESQSKAMGYKLTENVGQEWKGRKMTPPPLQFKPTRQVGRSITNLNMRKRTSADQKKSLTELKKESIKCAETIKGDKRLAGILSRLSPKWVDNQVPWMISNKRSRQKQPYRISFQAGKYKRQIMERLYGKGSVLNRESVKRHTLEIVYENDGTGINPGGGTDQGPTAKFYAFLHRKKKNGKGHYSLGATIMDMHTPVPPKDHTVPAGRQKHETVYDVKDKGPYSGIAALNFGVTYYQNGGWSLNFLQSVGIDDPRWGKVVQDFIHEKISNSPLFPWQGDKKLFLETGINASYTRQFKMMDVSGRIVLGTGVKFGTRGMEADWTAKMELDLIKLKGWERPLLSVEAGGKGNAHYRRNDGREFTHKGLEGGFIGGLKLSLGKRVSLVLTYEDIYSSDRTKQTGRRLSDTGWGQKFPPFRGRTAGGHNKGGVKLLVHF